MDCDSGNVVSCYHNVHGIALHDTTSYSLKCFLLFPTSAAVLYRLVSRGVSRLVGHDYGIVDDPFIPSFNDTSS